MKKLFCLILCLILTFSSISVFAQGYEIEKNTLSPLDAFTQKLTQLTKEYDSDNDGNIFSSEAIDENEIAHKDSTKRLIVKAKGKIDTLNAVEHIEGYNDLHILQFNTYGDMETALTFYKNCENIVYAQEDCINKVAEYEIINKNSSVDTVSTNVVANPMQDCSDEQGFTALRKKLADKNVVYTEEITVAVIDSGVEADHELLAGRVEPTGFDSIDGVSCDDRRGHGTHVAGIIVANTLDNVTVKPYRVLNEEGEGTDAQVVLGIEAAIEDGVDVINMSLGRRGESELMDEAIKKATDAGIIVVVSAGNDGTCLDTIPYTPACCDNVITVRACDEDLYGFPSFSNYGSMCETAAIGTNVKSSYLNNTYASLSGTSMSAPFVTAAVTYMLLDNPDTTYESATETIEKFEYNSCLYIEYIFDDNLTQLPAPKFSVESRDFSEDFYLELSCDVEDATIYYTLSTYPSGYKKSYTEPIKIKYDTVVTAYAFKRGAITSETVTATYTRIFPNEEDKYVINSSGYITEYLGPNEAGDTIIVIPDTIKGITPKVIDDQVFKNFDYIESVVLPDSITKIETQAFMSCNKLKYVTGKGVENIEHGAFDSCSNLLEFIGSKVTKIGGYSFAYCSSLQFIDIRNLTEIPACAFRESNAIQALISDKLTTIGAQAFYKTEIRTVDCPNVTKIDGSAFYHCRNLESVSIPQINYLRSSCFAGCTSLTKFEADSLGGVSEGVFSGCSSIETFSFPKLSIIGDGTDSTSSEFSGCTSLKNFDAPNVTHIGPRSFMNCSSLENLYFPIATSIKLEAFKNCTSLKTIYCPLVTTLKNDAFTGCTSLEELNFTEQITVSYKAFETAFTAGKVVFNNPKTIYAFPSGVPIALPCSFTPAPTRATENNIIYGTKGSPAETWANENGHTFIEITPETAIFNDIATYCQAYNQELYFDIIGLNRTYQWYGNNEKSTSGGTAIKGATSSKFSPNDYNTTYNYYYCIATSKDGDNDAIYITSTICTYSQTSIKPQGDTTINFKDFMLFTSETEKTILTDIVTFGDNGKYIPVPSYTSGSTDYFGTGSSFIVYTNGVPNTTFQIVVYGDINGDSICNVIDCFEVEKAANEHKELIDIYSLAADTDQNGIIDATDYQDIVNRAMR